MRIHEITEAIGPHAQQELKLMLQGTKPAALISAEDFGKWRPYIDKFKWNMVAFQDFAGSTSYAVSKDPHSAKQIAQLFQTAGGAAAKSVGPEFHTQLGRLLGYSAGDIAEFLQHISARPRASSLSAIGREITRGAGRVYRILGGVGAGLALHTSELGPTVPSAGPQRGNEINTDTGQPWTPEQLKRYNQTHGTE